MIEAPRGFARHEKGRLESRPEGITSGMDPQNARPQEALGLGAEYRSRPGPGMRQPRSSRPSMAREGLNSGIFVEGCFSGECRHAP